MIYSEDSQLLLKNGAVDYDGTEFTSLFIISSGQVGRDLVLSGDSADVTTYGTLYSTIINGGALRMYGGATHDTQAYATFSINGGSAFNSLIGSGGTLWVSLNCYASGVTVASGGSVYNSARIDNLTLQGGATMRLLGTGKVNNLLMASGARLSLYDGAAIGGTWDIHGAITFVNDGTAGVNAAGANVNLHLEDRAVGDAGLIVAGNLSNFNGASISIIVGDTQANGSYRLVDRYSELGVALTIKTVSGKTLGVLSSLNSMLVSNGNIYRLVATKYEYQREEFTALELSISDEADQWVAEGGTAQPGLVCYGTIGANNNLNDTFKLVVNESGIYNIDAIDLGTLTGAISISTVVNGKSKAVVSGKVANGKLTMKDTMLTAGNYVITVQSSGKDTRSVNYQYRVNALTLFPAASPNSSWERASIEHIADGVTGWVGFGDPADYMRVNLDTAGKYTFNVTASDAVTVTISALVGGKLKQIKNVKLKAGATAQLKDILLDSGDYYISVVSANAAKGGSANYTITESASSVRFVRGNNVDDNITALDGDYRIFANDSVTMLVEDEWVGFGDAIDYRWVTLESAAKLTFNVTATEAVRFTVYSLVNGKLKAVKSVSAKPGVTAQLKDILLDSGEYYIATESTTAKKGGNASYNVSLGSASAFFTRGNSADDSFAALSSEFHVTAQSGTGALVENEWVGFGDAIDYRKVTLESAAKLTFNVSASDAVRFTVYSLVNGKLKAVKNVTVKAGATAQLKDILLDSGDYYIAIESTNAKKGGNASYSVSLAGNSTFFTKGNNADDKFAALGNEFVFTAQNGTNELKVDDWVGYGDIIDYAKFIAESDGSAKIKISGVTEAVKLTLSQLVNGKLKKVKEITVKSGANGFELELAANEYFIAVESTTHKKGGGTGYSLQIDWLSSATEEMSTTALAFGESQNTGGMLA